MAGRVCIAVLCFALLALVSCTENLDASGATPDTAETGYNVDNPPAQTTAIKKQDTQIHAESHIKRADAVVATWAERLARAQYEPEAGAHETAQDR
jgi:hypothetical protein